MAKKMIGIFVLGLLAGGLIGYQQISSMSPEILEQLTAQLGSVQIVIAISMLQTAVLTALAAGLGMWLAPKTKLDQPFQHNRAAVVSMLLISVCVSLFIALAEKFIFIDALSLSKTYEFSWLYFAGSILYGGIIEEIMLRWGLMTLIVWCGMKLKKGELSSTLYFVGIFISATLFAAGHLPAAFRLMGTSSLVVIRTLALNFIPGVGLGYLYWKHGIGYAILGHMTVHVLNQLILFPLLF